MDGIKVGRFLAHLRQEAGWTQEQLGEKLGVTNKTVSRWENGHYLPDIDTFVQLSKLYDVSLNELVSGQRLDGRQLKAQADVNLIGAARGEIFPLRDRTAYWRRKWLAEHRALLIFAAAAFLALFAALYMLWGQWPLFFSPLAGCIVYAGLRNRMMIYIESHLYGP